MKATDLLALPTGVVLRPADTIDVTLRERLRHAPGDFVLTRPGSRSRSVLVDAAAADLLQLFQQPRTLVDAVIALSRRDGNDPERLLAEALPLIVHLRERRLLVVAGSEDAGEIKPTLAPASTFADLEVLECVHLFEDVEVYHAIDTSGRHAALKVLRPGAGARVTQGLEREAEILGRLGGAHAPAPLSRGEAGGRRFLVTSWCAGREVNEVADSLRGGSPSARAVEVAQLCVRMLRAYAQLHDRGVIHGDVHPGNIKIDVGGSVTILDFALSSFGAGETALPPLGRGGIPEYLEPEYCSAIMLGKRYPDATVLSEQYALGALCFFLLTGVHYLQFDFDQDGWMSQVANDAPRSFFASGCASWPAVERVLATALHKDPARRYPDLSAFADALESASRTPGGRPSRTSSREAFLAHTLLRFGARPTGIPVHALRAPTWTVNNGAAGIAYFYYRLACIRDDPIHLTTADLWSSWAKANAGGGREGKGQSTATRAAEAATSLFHGRAGVDCVDTLIRSAAGDNHAVALAAETFVAACERGSDIGDVVFGRAGLLLGAAALVEAIPAHSLADSSRGVRASIVEAADRLAAASPDDRAGSPDFAHGRAGAAFAQLRWCQATGRRPPGLGQALETLADAADPTANASSPAGVAARTSWCQGVAGHALLWNLADRCFPGGPFASLADAAANTIWRHRGAGAANASLCCGYAGQGYALLAQFRRTQDRLWLTRAEALCDLAIAVADSGTNRCSLYKGDVGVALLAAEFDTPEGACMPLIEAESRRPQ